MSRKAIFVAPFGELAEARVCAELAAEAEAAGWDGFFLWDHFHYAAPVREIADPWVTMAAIAMVTERIVTGPLITPLPRRRPHQLARETVTLDRLLGGGRLILGVGVGSERTGEFDAERFDEEPDMKVRGRQLDEALEKVQAYWDGEFAPGPVSKIPIWVAVRYPPNGKPLRRAQRYDGLFPIDQPDPDALREMIVDLPDGHDVVVTNPPGTDPAPWEAAGATWCLTGFGTQPTVADVRAAIRA